MKKTVHSFIFINITYYDITSQKIDASKFNIKKIEIDNNIVLGKKELKKSLTAVYDKNLLFLRNHEIKKMLINYSFIDSFEIKKKYPNTLKIKIFEKKTNRNSY